MEERSWSDCIARRTARTVTPNPAKARSLISTAEKRVRFLEQQARDESSINFLFESYYTSTLELLHAHCAKNGRNIANHLCIGWYVKEVLKREDLYRIFDICRYRRNRLAYYGELMEFAVAEKALKDVQRLYKELKKIVA